jgi:hypothetical protein
MGRFPIAQCKAPTIEGVSMPAKKKLRLDSPARYEMRIQGALDDSWKEHLNATTLEVQNRPGESPVTIAICEFIDQAALTGALSYVYNMGLPLISVKCIGIMPDAPD